LRGGAAGIRQQRREAFALDRHLRHSGNHRGRRHADDLEQRRRKIGGMAESVPQFATRSHAGGPGHHQRIADAATVGVLLVAAQRRIGRHRPAMRKIAVGVGPADVVDASDLLGQRLAQEVVRPHGVDHAQRAALLARAIVREHQHQRVLALAALVEVAQQPSDLLVGVIEHRGIGRLQAG
jgi:hypothetical protein